MAVDCLACGRTNVTFADSVDICNRVHCGAFDHFQRSVSGGGINLGRGEISFAPLQTAKQSRTDSGIEVALNILIGATVSLAAQALIFPAYGIHVGATTHVAVVWWFTVVSVARQYVLRRLLNGRSPWQALKSRFS